MRTSGTRFVLALTGALALAAAPPAVGQMEGRPGYFPIDELMALDADAVRLEINLAGGLLEVVASAVADEDPEFAALVRGLEGIQVRVAEAAEIDVEAVGASFGRAVDWLRSNGWNTFLRLREGDEQIYLYTRVEGGEMVGATLLVLEPASEVVVVNVVGRIDLALLAGLAETLDIPQIDFDLSGADADEAGEPE